jgi:hypothetical protein
MKSLRVLVAAAICSGMMVASGEAQEKPKVAPAARKAPRKVPVKAPEAPAIVTPEPPKPATDVRLKTAQTQGAQISYNTTYIQGARQRVEFPGVIAIDQCDLKQSVMLNLEAKRYRVQPYALAAGSAAAESGPADPRADQMAQMSHMGMAMPGAPGAKTRGGTVTVTTTLSDTLERQQMLGFEARHIKTVMVKQSSPTACDKAPLKVEVDAWYVDLPPQTGCARPAAQASPAPASDPDACTDHVETRVAGDVKLGFPVKSVTTTTTGEGDKVDVTLYTQEVTELEVTRLDRNLFEIPPGFEEAKSGAEIVPSLARGGSLSDAFFGSTADGSSVAAPKKAGMIRIGVLEPLNKTTRSLPPAGLRQDLVTKFKKAPYEAIPLKGTSPSEIEQEASNLACDYLLLSEITEVKSSKPGKLGGVMKLTGSAPKDSHEVKLDYKLFAVGATQTPKLSGNAKASSGGFGVGSALRLAAFAGRMYIGMGMMGGMGMGMMNPMAAMSGAGGLGSMGASFFDPRASAMSSLASGLGGGLLSGLGGGAGMGDPSESAMRDTVSEALENEANAAMEQLGKNPKK